MSEECFGGSPASDDFSVSALCPFCGSDSQGRTMEVCSIEKLNEYLSSHPLTIICQTKYGKLRQKYEYCFANVAVPIELILNTYLTV
jgi:hypothetical protein